MKVLLYSEGMKWISKSGLGRAIEHQKAALESVGLTYTTNQAEAVDVVHINTYFLRSLLLAKRKRRKGIPVVYHAHSTEEDFRNSFLFSNAFAPIFGRWIVHCYNQGDVVITPTLYAKKLLEHSGVVRPIYPVSNGINLSTYRKMPNMRETFRKKYGYTSADRVVMSAGLYMKRKGILDFVELAKRMPEYQFIWFGYLNLKQVPKEVREAVQIQLPNLQFAGYVQPEVMKEAYAGADLFFFPTYEETEGIVLLEAMAMQQNILIRDIPIYQELFQDGVHLYKGKNIQEFEENIKKIISGEYPPLVEQAYERVKEKDIPYIGKKLLEVYQAALKKQQ